MLFYPTHVQEDDRGSMARSPDVPELTTVGDNRQEALVWSVYALEEAIAARMRDNGDVSAPSAGNVCVPLPALAAVKVILCQGMRDQGTGRAELPRETPVPDRLLRHPGRSRFQARRPARRDRLRPGGCGRRTNGVGFLTLMAGYVARAGTSTRWRQVPERGEKRGGGGRHHHPQPEGDPVGLRVDPGVERPDVLAEAVGHMVNPGVEPVAEVVDLRVQPVAEAVDLRVEHVGPAPEGPEISPEGLEVRLRGDASGDAGMDRQGDGLGLPVRESRVAQALGLGDHVEGGLGHGSGPLSVSVRSVLHRSAARVQPFPATRTGQCGGGGFGNRSGLSETMWRMHAAFRTDGAGARALP